MNVLLIDDEMLALNILEEALNHIGGIKIIGKSTLIDQALLVLKQQEVDVVFLDVAIEGQKGLSFARQLTEKYPHVQLVVVTAHTEFALEAFEINVKDYLKKPVQLERLTKTINRVKEYQELQSIASEQKMRKKERLRLQTLGRFRLLDKNNVEVKWRTQKARELLAFLWQHQHQDQPIYRENILESLWPNMELERAQTLMHTTLYQLRQVLKKVGFPNAVILQNAQYILQLQLSSDLDELLLLMSQSSPDTTTVVRIKELYGTEYLEYEAYNWAWERKINIRREFLHFMEKFLPDMEQNIQQQRIKEQCLERMLKLEPFNINYTEQLLHHYGQMNNMHKLVECYQKSRYYWLHEFELGVPQQIIRAYEYYVN